MPPKKPAKKQTWNDKLSRLRHKASALSERHGMQNGYRSGLEVKMALALNEMNVGFDFEGEKIAWTPLPIPKTYSPDFPLNHVTKQGKRLYLETKGRFMPDDMAKHVAVKLQHPDKDIRIVFQKVKAWYRAAKRMSYGGWCEKNGIKCCGFPDIKEIIPQWIKE